MKQLFMVWLMLFSCMCKSDDQSPCEITNTVLDSNFKMVCSSVVKDPIYTHTLARTIQTNSSELLRYRVRNSECLIGYGTIDVFKDLQESIPIASRLYSLYSPAIQLTQIEWIALALCNY